ncbi:hypothetical protein [Pseudarthrobacter sp. N5]|uniref:hypothetical protein n=1 Tax=Pseudarthrobacter sp. N5 TaxID=3418416 RepID=UPI003CEE8298
MTELNEHMEPAAAQPEIGWPEVSPSDSGPRDGNETFTGDVGAVLDRLDAVRLLPVAEHDAVYTDLHDSLLEALNEDTSASNGDS